MVTPLPDNPTSDQITQHIQDVLDQREYDNAYGVSLIPSHAHTGTDSQQISFTDLTNQPSLINSLVGDGSDGNVTISSPTTLTRDMFYDNLIVNANVDCGGYKVFAKTSVTVNNAGFLRRYGNSGLPGNNGNSGSGATGGIHGTQGSSGGGLSSGSLYGALGIAVGEPAGTDGAGGTTSNGNQATGGANGLIGTPSIESIGLAGISSHAGVAGGSSGNGAGGTGVSSQTPGLSAIGGGITPPIASVRNIHNALLMIDTSASPPAIYQGGGSSATNGGSSGGSGGAGNGVGQLGGAGGGAGGNGGSGGNGGIVFVSSPLITVNNGGSISVEGGFGGNGGNGGAGQNAPGTNSGGGGGGGAGNGGSGGTGGVMILIYSTLTVASNGLLNAIGGIGGTGGTGGAKGLHTGTGTDGTAGANGTNGNNGSAGVIYEFEV